MLTPCLQILFARNQQAAAAGHAAVVRELIAAGAPLGDTLESRVSAGHLAARGGHLAALEALVAAGLNVRATTLDRCARCDQRRAPPSMRLKLCCAACTCVSSESACADTLAPSCRP